MTATLTGHVDNPVNGTLLSMLLREGWLVSALGPRVATTYGSRPSSRASPVETGLPLPANECAPRLACKLSRRKQLSRRVTIVATTTTLTPSLLEAAFDAHARADTRHALVHRPHPSEVKQPSS